MEIGGWVGSCGPVNIDPIWALMLTEPEREHRLVIWNKVPSHVTIEGNNEVDRLATVGLHSRPLYPLKHTPHKEVNAPCTPPLPHKRAKELSLTRPRWVFRSELIFLLPPQKQVLWILPEPRLFCPP